MYVIVRTMHINMHVDIICAYVHMYVYYVLLWYLVFNVMTIVHILRTNINYVRPCLCVSCYVS